METLVIITNRIPLAKTIRRLMESRFAGKLRILSVTSGECPALLPRLVAEADLFILELLWRFPGGVQAQGINIARRLLQKKKAFLIISSFCMSQSLSCLSYWDMEAEDSITERLDKIIHIPVSFHQELDNIAQIFSKYEELPRQHGVR